MVRLSLTLLGGFEARLDADRALRLSIKKGQALLAYLAMPPGKPHLRDKLATLLWGDLPERSARKGLCQTLFMLGRLLGEANPLRLEGEAVALDPVLVATDVAELEACAAEGTRPALERAVRERVGGGLDGPLRALTYRVTCIVTNEATQLLVSTASFTRLTSSAQARTR